MYLLLLLIIVQICKIQKLLQKLEVFLVRIEKDFKTKKWKHKMSLKKLLYHLRTGFEFVPSQNTINTKISASIP